MVRLMLVLAPVACVLGAVGVSSTLETYMKYIKTPQTLSASKAKAAVTFPVQKEISYTLITGVTILLLFYTFHCTWVSGPACVFVLKWFDVSSMSAGDIGSLFIPFHCACCQATRRYRMIFDDFREAYRWLNYNTAPDSRVMSW